MSINAAIALSLFGGSIGTQQVGDAGQAVALLKRVTTPGAETKAIAQQQKDPVTLTALKQFNAAIAKSTDLKAALGDPRILNVLLPAVGLADQTGYPGLAQRVLLSDLSDKKSLANTLGGAWLNAAKTLDLKNKGLAGLTDPVVIAGLVGKFVGYEYHSGLDHQQPGISDALYFLDNAASIAKSGNVYDILGNGIIRRVVTRTLGLPPELAVQPIESQATAITSRLKVSSLTDQRQVEKFAQRYLITRANEAQAGTGTSSPLLSLLA